MKNENFHCAKTLKGLMTQLTVVEKTINRLDREIDALYDDGMTITAEKKLRRLGEWRTRRHYIEAHIERLNK